MILRTRANVANKPIPAWNRHTLDLEEERERETCVCASESERKGKSFLACRDDVVRLRTTKLF